MSEMMSLFLVSFYGLSHEGAKEVVHELRDKRSLMSLIGYRGARAVPTATLSNDLEG
jgi:hypothetical protein